MGPALTRSRRTIVCAALALAVAGAGVAIWASTRPTGRCGTLAGRYGLAPCPDAPLPVAGVPIRNLDHNLSDADAQRIGRAYVRSYRLYYDALAANSEKFFHAKVIHLPDESPLMFGAEIQHIRDARAAHGRLVVQSAATLLGVTVVPLPDDLRDSLGTKTRPIGDAVVIDTIGPEKQLIRARGRPDQTVTELAAGDRVQRLVGGVLVTAPGLDETFAELGQWECLDPDTHGACQLPPGGPG